MSVFKKLCLILFSLTLSAPVWAEKIWIDVRSTEEYSQDHIVGDANIPLASLDATALATQYGKEAEIILYCRSGNRAGQAKTQLEAAGFTHVSNGGSIGDVRKQRELPIPQASPAQ
jgi:phage shock protein E